MSFKLVVACIAMGLCLTAGVAFAQDDPIGKVDTVSLYVETIADGKWMVSAHVWNDEELAAIDIPLKYTAGIAKIFVDSVVFKGTRIEGFALKSSQVDTVKQIMDVGGIAFMDPVKPPLPVGKGEVARIFLSAKGEKKPGAFAIDTTAYPPNSSLMLVDVNAKTIVPALKIEYKKAAAAPPAKKQ
ncbi:MAG: hypothetical protein PHR28_02570 [candidate division Zixibacteria bacterium]|nr:hypothetical protein [candidate division Zixibacteria bacterium]